MACSCLNELLYIWYHLFIQTVHTGTRHTLQKRNRRNYRFKTCEPCFQNKSEVEVHVYTDLWESHNLSASKYTAMFLAPVKHVLWCGVWLGLTAIMIQKIYMKFDEVSASSNSKKFNVSRFNSWENNFFLAISCTDSTPKCDIFSLPLNRNFTVHVMCFWSVAQW